MSFWHVGHQVLLLVSWLYSCFSAFSYPPFPGTLISSVALLFFCFHLNCYILWVLRCLFWVISSCLFPLWAFFLIPLGHTQFSLHDFLMFFAGRFRTTDHMQDWLAICFLIIVLPSWGPTPFILLFYILTEQCVTPPHPQSCSLTHGGLCRATHSPGSVAAQKTETGTFAWTLPPEACEIPRIFDGFLS